VEAVMKSDCDETIKKFIVVLSKEYMPH
jgi:hypothetical protein